LTHQMWPRKCQD